MSQSQACMGGWCERREACPNYHVLDRGNAVERLCDPVPVKPQRTRRPIAGMAHKREAVLDILTDVGQRRADLQGVTGLKHKGQFFKFMAGLVRDGKAFICKCKVSETVGRAEALFFATAAGRDQYLLDHPKVRARRAAEKVALTKQARQAERAARKTEAAQARAAAKEAKRGEAIRARIEQKEQARAKRTSSTPGLRKSAADELGEKRNRAEAQRGGAYLPGDPVITADTVRTYAAPLVDRHAVDPDKLTRTGLRNKRIGEYDTPPASCAARLADAAMNGSKRDD